MFIDEKTEEQVWSRARKHGLWGNLKQRSYYFEKWKTGRQKKVDGIAFFKHKYIKDYSYRRKVTCIPWLGECGKNYQV